MALRLLSPLVDLLLDCFTALLVDRDGTPVQVSTFAELAEALICEDQPAVATPPIPPKNLPVVDEDGYVEGPVLANTSPAVEWMSPPL